MKREFLKTLGIEDEMINKIMDEHGKSIGAEIAKTQAAQTVKTQFEEQLRQREKEFEEVKKAADGNADLSKKLSEIEESSKTQKADFDRKLRMAAARAEIGDAVHDVELYLGLIDLSKIDLDDNGSIKAGFKEQREKIDKEKPFLLKQPQQGGKPTGYRPQDGTQPKGNGETNPFAKETFSLAEQGKIFKADPTKARELAAAANYQL